MSRSFSPHIRIIKIQFFNINVSNGFTKIPIQSLTDCKMSGGKLSIHEQCPRIKKTRHGNPLFGIEIFYRNIAY